jgi:predicted O-methyltransferase YrrM
MSEVITFNTDNNTVQHQIQKYESTWNIVNNLVYYQNVVEKQVRGWLYVHDHALIHMIMKDIQKNIEGDICEIGVAFGRSAIALSNYRPITDRLYLYDIYFENGLTESNLKEYGTSENIEWRLQDTTKLTTDTIEFNKPLRLLHIDGCHEDMAVYNDLKNFSTKMSKDGVIVVDDYSDPEYPGINSATLRFLYENKDWVMFAIGSNKAFLCHINNRLWYITKTLEHIREHNKFGLDFKTHMRDINGLNVLLCCSREPNDIDENSIDSPVIIG